MAYELIQDVHTCRGLWKDALDSDMSADELIALRERYRKAMRMNVVYSRICDEQHAAFLADMESARNAQRAEWEPLSKAKLAELLGYRDCKHMTKEQMIESALFSRIHIEGSHERIKRAWAAMSEAEREGL